MAQSLNQIIRVWVVFLYSASYVIIVTVGAMNLPELYISEIKSILESISKSLPGYSTRISQKRMIACVGTVLSQAEVYVKKEGETDESATSNVPENTGRGIVLVEGPTGVGKSLGYLIPATVAAKDKKRKIVVSSATVALQEQLAGRDIPFFVKNSGLKLSCALAKGRTRYVCRERLQRVAGSATQEDMFIDEAEHKHNDQDSALYAELLVKYENGKWTGDRDELPSPVPDALWTAITTDRGGCLNSKCDSFKKCAQMAAREGIKKADIVVVNHDLLLADMALGGGVILPEPSECFYVVDEAHHLPDKAVSAFSSEHRVDGGRVMMGKLAAISSQIGRAFPDLTPKSVSLSRDAEDLGRRLGEVYQMLASIDPKAYSGNLWRFPNNEFPAKSMELGNQVLLLASSVRNDIRNLGDSLSSYADGPSAEMAKKMLSDLGFYGTRVDAILETWAMLLKVSEDDSFPVAKWVEKIAKGNTVEFIIKVCPVFAGELLRDLFFSQTDGVVLTSATLRTLGSFDTFLRDSGLDYMPDISALALPSPFNHAEQGVLYIPPINVSAKDAEAHTQAVAALLPDAIKATGNRGTLVLFASRKQMTEVLALLPAAVQKLVLMQGDRPKGVLLDEHNARIERGEPSVLFGLQSFSEGLDLPGDACAHVIIAKIPFAVPSDPVQQTLSEWLERRNRSYFMEIALPQACLRLIQGAGRLIRTENDRGAITILDDRITTKKYGKQILDAMPPFNRVSNGMAVLNHIGNVKEAQAA